MIVNIINPTKANIGTYMSGEYIKSTIFGASRFCAIIFSNPLPTDAIKNAWGIIPNNVAQKKFFAFTLNMHGNTLDNAKGIPPIKR